MPRQASETLNVYYVALTPDEEWIMAVQAWPGRKGDYRMRIVRRGHIMVDGGFRLVAGETIRDRLQQGCEEWVRDRGGFERMFHQTAREMGVPIPSYARRGRTPFNCTSEEFMDLVKEWAGRVPPQLVARDYLVFRRWMEADLALLLS